MTVIPGSNCTGFALDSSSDSSSSSSSPPSDWEPSSQQTPEEVVVVVVDVAQDRCESDGEEGTNCWLFTWRVLQFGPDVPFCDLYFDNSVFCPLKNWRKINQNYIQI